MACKNGNVKIIDLLLTNEKINYNKKNKLHNTTPFYIACIFGHYDVVVTLLKQKDIDIHTPDKDLFTPLHAACVRGYDKMAKLLLNNHFKNVNDKNHLGRTALYTAVQQDHVNVVEQLIKWNNQQIEKIKNSDDNNKNNKIITINPNICDDSGMTPLHCACMSGNFKIVSLLLNSTNDHPFNNKQNISTSLESTNYDGKTPLNIAKQYFSKRHKKIVKLIEEKKNG